MSHAQRLKFLPLFISQNIPVYFMITDKWNCPSPSRVVLSAAVDERVTRTLVFRPARQWHRAFCWWNQVFPSQMLHHSTFTKLMEVPLKPLQMDALAFHVSLLDIYFSTNNRKSSWNLIFRRAWSFLRALLSLGWQNSPILSARFDFRTRLQMCDHRHTGLRSFFHPASHLLLHLQSISTPASAPGNGKSRSCL